MVTAHMKEVEQGAELSPRPSFPTRSAGASHTYQLGIQSSCTQHTSCSHCLNVVTYRCCWQGRSEFNAAQHQWTEGATASKDWQWNCTRPTNLPHTSTTAYSAGRSRQGETLNVDVSMVISEFYCRHYCMCKRHSSSLLKARGLVQKLEIQTNWRNRLIFSRLSRKLHSHWQTEQYRVVVSMLRIGNILMSEREKNDKTQ